MVALAGETMGTTWRVQFAQAPAMEDADVRIAIEARLDGLVAEMSHWDPASHLSRINRSPAGHWTTLPADFAAVIGTALRIAAASGGAFDPAIGRLVDLWGHGPHGRRPRPDDAAIEEARATSGWRRLAWDPERRRLRQPGGLALDLSGIAKGFAVDAVADLLGDIGIRHCLVEIGGELVGRGMRPDGDPWWVDLEDPPGADLPGLRIALHGLAVATSGNYVRGDHTIDPRTGYPSVNGVVAVSVIADSAMVADALATAIAILYPDLDGPIADCAARIVIGNGGRYGEVLTPRLQAMIAA